MSQYSPSVDKSRSLDGGDENAERAVSDLPDEPNPEHPKHDYDGAHRAYKWLKSGRRDWDDLGAREYGLLLWWYPRLFREFVQEEA